MTSPKDTIEMAPTGWIGRVLNDAYEIKELLGQGGLGVVFRAHQLSVGRDVALKLVSALREPRVVGRLQVEARTIARLRHPNTIRLIDCQSTPEGDFFLVTELLSGEPLSKALRRQGCLPVTQALRIIDQICRSLAEAHQAGIIHRDLKPDNVFLEQVGEEELVRVLDFGMAKVVGDRDTKLTMEGRIAGTPLYMAPEQILGKDLDSRTDVYALGLLLHELLCGKPPFMNASVMATLSDHVMKAPPPLRSLPGGQHVPPAVERLVLDLLAKAPADRPPSVEEVRARILPIAAALTAGPAPGIEDGALEAEPTTVEPMEVSLAKHLPVLSSTPPSGHVAKPTVSAPSVVVVPVAVSAEATPRTRLARRRWPWALGALIAALLFALVVLVTQLSANGSRSISPAISRESGR
jgi:serine/threonine-protein kinase